MNQPRAGDTLVADVKIGDPATPITAYKMGWRCRRGRHQVDVRSWNLSGNQSYRSGLCVRCQLPMQQHLTWGGMPTGPWRHDYRPPCTHGVNGANLGRHNCMRCGNEHSARGLRW